MLGYGVTDEGGHCNVRARGHRAGARAATKAPRVSGTVGAARNALGLPGIFGAIQRYLVLSGAI